MVGHESTSASNARVQAQLSVKTCPARRFQPRANGSRYVVYRGNVLNNRPQNRGFGCGEARLLRAVRPGVHRHKYRQRFRFTCGRVHAVGYSLTSCALSSRKDVAQCAFAVCLELVYQRLCCVAYRFAGRERDLLGFRIRLSRFLSSLLLDRQAAVNRYAGCRGRRDGSPKYRPTGWT